MRLTRVRLKRREDNVSPETPSNPYACKLAPCSLFLTQARQGHNQDREALVGLLFSLARWPSCHIWPSWLTVFYVRRCGAVDRWIVGGSTSYGSAGLASSRDTYPGRHARHGTGALRTLRMYATVERYPPA